jgi:tetratricopeptide (TPR) repeat protein
MLRYRATSVLFAAAVISLVVGCDRAPDDEVLQRFLSAQQVYDEAESQQQFVRAAGLYQEILDSGFVSGAVLYNQGNAFLRAGQRGRAIACYRQAKRYCPQDPFVDGSLRSALDADDSNPRRVFIDYVFFWQDWIGYGGKFHLFACSAALTFAIGVAALFAGRRRWVAYCGWAGLVVTIVMAASAAYDWYRFESVQHGVVVVDDVVALKGPADSFKEAFTQPLSQGTEFVVAEHRGDWLLIRLPGSKEGWVKAGEVVVY